MINGNLEDFLDTGWYMESTLFYHGYVYWCEGYTEPDTEISTFFVDSWRAKCEDNKFYHEYRTTKNELLDEKRVFEEYGPDMDLLKKHFLEAKIFDGKSFWEVEKNLIWVDEDTPIYVKDGAADAGL